MANWTPAEEGALKLSPILAPLEPYKDQVVVVSNLVHAMAGPQGPGDNGGDHTRCPAVFLNGVHPKRTDGADIYAGVTIDQIAAQQNRSGDAAAVAGTGHRGLQRTGRIVRRRFQLHLHEYDFLAHADDTRCPWKSIRAWFSTACSAMAQPGKRDFSVSKPSAAFSMR